jgi:hypothetical protein
MIVLPDSGDPGLPRFRPIPGLRRPLEHLQARRPGVRCLRPRP